MMNTTESETMYRRLQSHVPDAILQPASWPSMYEDFVTKNAHAVGQIETALRSLTYIIPGETRSSRLMPPVDLMLMILPSKDGFATPR